MGKQRLERLGFTTTNIGKLEEARRILGLPIEHLSFLFQEPQDVRGEGIAAAKARAAYAQFQTPLFVDHTSLYFEAWNDLPGGLIGTILRQVGDAGVVKMMNAYKNRNALGQTTIAFFDGLTLELFIGEMRGTIPRSVSGVEYTGWDRIFTPENQSKTYGEMSFEEKNAISQRREALDLLKVFLLNKYDFSTGSKD